MENKSGISGSSKFVWLGDEKNGRIENGKGLKK